MRVIYISCIPLTPRIARDWYIDYLLESGVKVEYWDITEMVRGNVLEHYQHNQAYVRFFKSYSQFQSAVFAENKSVFVLLLFRIWKFRRVYKILVSGKVKAVTISWGFLPTPAKKITTLLTESFLRPQTIFNKIVNRICGFLLSLKQFNLNNKVVFAAGNVAVSRVGGGAKVVPIALCDYDQYKQTILTQKIISNKKYALYLDTYLPYHSDLALAGMKPLSPEKYYSDLNIFFSEVESQFGMNVIVAAHPKALYTKDHFFGREVIYSRTAELVRDASLVISHASTSISYAVLCAKPIIFIYTDEMHQLYKSGYMQFIYAMADYLHAPLINITSEPKTMSSNIFNFSVSRYASYINDFIATSEARRYNSKEAFLNEVLLLYGS